MFFVLDTVLPQGEWEPWGEDRGESLLKNKISGLFLIITVIVISITTVLLANSNNLSDITIEGIMYQPNGDSIVILNGKICSVGSMIDSFKVEEIKEKEIILSKEGNEYTLGVNYDPTKPNTNQEAATDTETQQEHKSSKQYVESSKDISINEWIKRRHGLIFYQDYKSDKYSLIKLTSMAKEIGTNNIKTWLKGYKPGEIPNTAKNTTYKNIFKSFDVICLNVCPIYMLKTWDNTKKYTPKTSKAIKQDYYALTKYLIKRYSNQNKTFIINYFFEANVYMATSESHRPDFPILEFIADAQAGVKKALKETRPTSIRILDCLESNCSHDYFNFVKNIFPKVSVDLYSVSFYGYGSLASKVNYWEKFAPDNKLFGNKNVIVGEYGIMLEDPRIEGNEEAQNHHLISIRNQAKELDVPYIFLFWLADQESKVKAEGRYGMVSLKGNKRKAWSDLNKSYKSS